MHSPKPKWIFSGFRSTFLTVTVIVKCGTELSLGLTKHTWLCGFQKGSISIFSILDLHSKVHIIILNRFCLILFEIWKITTRKLGLDGKLTWREKKCFCSQNVSFLRTNARLRYNASMEAMLLCMNQCLFFSMLFAVTPMVHWVCCCKIFPTPHSLLLADDKF